MITLARRAALWALGLDQDLAEIRLRLAHLEATAPGSDQLADLRARIEEFHSRGHPLALDPYNPLPRQRRDG
jgi:hypothetical protein